MAVMTPRAVGLVILLLVLPASAVAEVNVYSARKEALIKPLLARFTADTGIEVNLVSGNADALLQRLQSEGPNSPADLFITVDAGRLHRAKQAGVLQPVDSVVLRNAVPASYRDPDGFWFGLSLRARPIMYATDRVAPAELPTYEGLADPRWRSRLCIRSSDNIYNQSMVASIIAANGPEQALQWARGLVANLARAPKGGDRDQIMAAAAGQCDIAIANTYYLGQMLKSEDEQQRKAAGAVAIHWPNQNGRGVHLNVSGAAVTAAAKHTEDAVKLLEYLTDEPAQRWYAEANDEYPVRPATPLSPTVAAWGTFKADTVNMAVLGELNAEAVRVMDRAGWK